MQPIAPPNADSRKVPPWLARPLMVMGGIALVGVCGWYGPLITASLWHIWHPRGWVEYRGLRVRVPWPWVADTESVEADPTLTPQGLQLRKMPREALHHLPPQSIFVTVISPDPGVNAEEQTAKWMEMFRRSHPEAKFSARTPVPVPDGAQCLSATGRPSPADTVWTCISVNHGWVATFEGGARSAPAFFQLVAGLKASN